MKIFIVTVFLIYVIFIIELSSQCSRRDWGFESHTNYEKNCTYKLEYRFKPRELAPNSFV